MFRKKEDISQVLFERYKNASQDELEKITVANGYTEEAEKVAREILNSEREEYYENLRLKEEYEQALANHIFTTGYNFEGYRIIEYLGLVSGESVIGTGYISDLKAGFSDLFGVESEAYSNKIKYVKKAALYDLLHESVEKGGNATIGISYDYVTFSGNMIGVSVNGTCVKIEKI